MCSQSLQRMDAKEIGRWLLTSDLEHLVKIGMTSALHHVKRVFPWLKEA